MLNLFCLFSIWADHIQPLSKRTELISPVVQGSWVAPCLPDFSTSIPLESTYHVEWDANLTTWFPQYAPNADISSTDLWVTGSEDNPKFQYQIQTNINMTETFSVSWVVNVLPSQLHDTSSYAFRFLPGGQSYTASSNESQISSPIFILTPAASAPSHTAAIAGGVVGGVGGVVVAMVLVWLVLRLRRTRAVRRENQTIPEKAQLHSDDLKIPRKELEGTQAHMNMLQKKPIDVSEMPANEEVVDKNRLKELPSNEPPGQEMETTEHEIAALDRMARMNDATILDIGTTRGG